MKRFTETLKWQDPWFRRLSGPAKLLWVYLTDHCDNVGVVEVDLELISMDIGLEVTPKNLDEFGDRLKAISTSKVFIRKFIPFQYGQLSESCPAHKKVLQAVESHGLVRVVGGYDYPTPTDYPTPSLVIGYRKGKEEEEDRNKNEEGMQGEKVPSPLEALKARVGGWFNRRESTAWSEKELKALRAVIAMQTPEEDIALLESRYKAQTDPYLRRDILTLLNNWSGEIDRSKNTRPHATPRSSSQRSSVSDERNRFIGQPGCENPAEVDRPFA